MPQAVARTAGAALDALAAELPAEERGTLVIVKAIVPTNSSTSSSSGGWPNSWHGGARLGTEADSFSAALSEVVGRNK